MVTFPNGDCYAGTFHHYVPENQNDYPNGKGLLLKQDGTRYVGEFHEEGDAGRGVMIRGDGTMCLWTRDNGEDEESGDLCHNVEFPHGIHYQGQVDGEAANGYGVATFPDEGRYAGEFHHYAPNNENDSPVGIGVYLSQGGSASVGEFNGAGRLQPQIEHGVEIDDDGEILNWWHEGMEE